MKQCESRYILVNFGKISALILFKSIIRLNNETFPYNFKLKKRREGKGLNTLKKSGDLSSELKAYSSGHLDILYTLLLKYISFQYQRDKGTMSDVG